MRPNQQTIGHSESYARVLNRVGPVESLDFDALGA